MRLNSKAISMAQSAEAKVLVNPSTPFPVVSLMSLIANHNLEKSLYAYVLLIVNLSFR